VTDRRNRRNRRDRTISPESGKANRNLPFGAQRHGDQPKDRKSKGPSCRFVAQLFTRNLHP
jgi:hypothetical protein